MTYGLFQDWFGFGHIGSLPTGPTPDAGIFRRLGCIAILPDPEILDVSPVTFLQKMVIVLIRRLAILKPKCEIN